MEAALSHEQLPLFRRWIPQRAKPKRRRLLAAISRIVGWVQLEFTFQTREDDDDAWDFPVRRIVRATDAEPIRSRAPASIFDFAARLASSRRKPPEAQDSQPAKLPAVAVHRANGTTRIVGGMYPANRWTPEKEEAERIRRAKQRPPKPPKAAKTRGRKVREWDGEVMG